MQNEPEKIVGNYNELRSLSPGVLLPTGVIELQSETEHINVWQETIKAGLELVNGKINQLLGSNNRLTSGHFAFPKVNLIGNDPERPDVAGYFFSSSNEITIVTDRIADDGHSRSRVFIHEFLHFLSHNGRDDDEQIHEDAPLTRKNNVGFRRSLGFDIRKGKEGTPTTDYFLSFNEAVTEQLTMDILPGDHGVYSEYRGLLNQVLDDAVTRKLGSKDENGMHRAWSKEQLKKHIYVCFFRGDLAGFTKLLKTVYEKFDISEQQFGLMTNKDDLPSLIEKRLMHDEPGKPPPSASRVMVMVQRRLDAKAPTDYVTDIIGTDPGDDGDEGAGGYGVEYDSFIKAHQLTAQLKESVAGTEYDVDNLGLIIYRGDDASQRLNYIRSVLDSLMVRLSSGEIDKTAINEQVDGLLFRTYRLSMLSDGFRDFYIYKHAALDKL